MMHAALRHRVGDHHATRYFRLVINASNKNLELIPVLFSPHAMLTPPSTPASILRRMPSDLYGAPSPTHVRDLATVYVELSDAAFLGKIRVAVAVRRFKADLVRTVAAGWLRREHGWRAVVRLELAIYKLVLLVSLFNRLGTPLSS